MTSEAPFQRTTELFVNPVPITVSVNAGPPVCAEPGLKLRITGAARIVNVAGADVIGPGTTTVTDAEPAEAISGAGTTAVSCDAET